MAPSTPSTPESGPAKKPAARKSSTRKPAAKAVAKSSEAKQADAAVTPSSKRADAPATADSKPAKTQTAAKPEQPVVAAPDSGPLPETASADAAAAERNGGGDVHQRGSILDRVRANRVGPPAVGLVVALGVGLLLSVLVPADPNALALTILGALLAAAVGFSMRYLSILRNVARQFEALVVTVLGVHVMAVTGAVSVDIPFLSELGASGPGFNEALLAALAIPPVSSGGIIAGIVAAMIVGWGPNPKDD